MHPSRTRFMPCAQVARDLEDPYNHDPNELALVIMVCKSSIDSLIWAYLPSALQQRNFNSRIQALTNEKGYEVKMLPK